MLIGLFVQWEKEFWRFLKVCAVRKRILVLPEGLCRDIRILVLPEGLYRETKNFGTSWRFVPWDKEFWYFLKVCAMIKRSLVLPEGLCHEKKKFGTSWRFVPWEKEFCHFLKVCAVRKRILALPEGLCREKKNFGSSWRFVLWEKEFWYFLSIYTTEMLFNKGSYVVFSCLSFPLNISFKGSWNDSLLKCDSNLFSDCVLLSLALHTTQCPANVDTIFFFLNEAGPDSRINIFNLHPKPSSCWWGVTTASEI